MLRIEGLDVYHGYVQAVRGLSLHVKEGELLAILGANGAGKSTLLGTLAGLHKPAKGNILVKRKGDTPPNKEKGNTPVGGMSQVECPQLWKDITNTSPEKMVRQGISLVPERREIFSSLSVLDNLMLGAYHRYRRDKATILCDVREVMEIFPALKGREKEMAGTLSGGLQQMLAIGRALMAHPKLLLLDEPSVGLAPLVVREIMSILSQLKKTGVTIMLVEQNTRAALKVADRALVMERGSITISGSSAELMSDSKVQQAYLGRARVQPAWGQA
ncbi:ABC transporter ATP-binding protein [Desulfotruncus alcoholivorax]|uniref:ABC transporter ATP-binding protein n=1 Tax=Desulfotruncus alcoholivorax TaxID=265477 RepID=UPI00041C0295|nr:ABC transporter ATP-binding protein [Desulfotruncus alcoholivorax]